MPHLCCLLLLLALPAAPRAETPPEFSQLLEDINDIRRAYRVPAVAVTLVTPQALLWSAGIGYADPANREPATPDTLYRVAAASRTLAALAALLAAERGWLSLDDRLAVLAPALSLENPWEDTHPVRLAQLLEQTAGLLDGASPDNGQQRCHWPPGLYASPASAGTGLAIQALQPALPQPYADFVRRRLFAPLGMQASHIGPAPETRTRLANAYDADGKTLIVPQPDRRKAPPTPVSTPREMAALLQLLLARGRVGERVLVPESAMQRMETPRSTLAAWQGLEFGQGPGTDQALHRGFLFYGQDGEAAGHLSRYAYSHALGLGYLVVINARQPAALTELRLRIEDHLVAGKTPTEPPLAVLDREQLERLAGRYRPLTWRFPETDPGSRAERDFLELSLSGSRLQLRTTQGQQHELLPVGERLFRRSGQPLATSAFVEYGDDVYLLGEFGNYLKAPAGAHGKAQR